MQERETVQEKQSKLERIYDPNLRAEAAVHTIMEMSKAMEAQTFATPEEADAANRQYREDLNNVIMDVSGFEDIQFEISGSGVMKPDISINAGDVEGKAMSYVVSLDSPRFEGMEPFDSEIVTFISMMTDPYEDEEVSAYRIDTRMVMSSSQPRNVQMTSSNIPAPIATIFVFPTFLVDMSGDSVIQIPELEQKRSKIELMQEIARGGLTDEIFRRSLSKFRNAFRSTPEDSYTDFEDMDVLHDLGRISNEQARRGERSSDLMSRAVLDAIGKGRYVIVEGVPKGHEESPIDTIITGQVIEVLMPSSQDDDITPTFVVETVNAQAESENFLYPLERISSLRF